MEKTEQIAERCHCSAEEVIAGHRADCPLNVELAPHPIAPRKPFEEMTRDEMIVAHAELRASIAQYVSGYHESEASIARAQHAAAEAISSRDAFGARAERAESDAAALKDQRTKLHVKLIALLHRFGTGETEEQDGENIAAMVERMASDAAESKRRCGELSDACWQLMGFTKHNPFPSVGDDGFTELTCKLDRIEAVLLKLKAAALTPEASK